jgi:hypothetical protein
MEMPLKKGIVLTPQVIRISHDQASNPGEWFGQMAFHSDIFK